MEWNPGTVYCQGNSFLQSVLPGSLAAPGLSTLACGPATFAANLRIRLPGVNDLVQLSQRGQGIVECDALRDVLPLSPCWPIKM
jgi:hypothetical protein